MFPSIPLAFVHFLAIVGIVFLFFWWLLHLRSGRFGFLLVVIGSVALLSLAFGFSFLKGIASMLSISMGIVGLAGVLLFSVAFGLITISSRRSFLLERASAHLPSPEQMQCPYCTQHGYLHDYEVPVEGSRHRMIQRMCNDCAARRSATLV